MLLKYAQGIPISAIARRYRCSAMVAEENIEMALRQEVIAAREKEHKKFDRREVTTEMMDWILDLSCQNPRSLGYKCVEWPPSLLAQHVRDHCRAVGFHALAGVRCNELAGLLARNKSLREMASIGG